MTHFFTVSFYGITSFAIFIISKNVREIKCFLLNFFISRQRKPNISYIVLLGILLQ